MAKTRIQRLKELEIPETFAPQFIANLDRRCGIVKEIRRRYQAMSPRPTACDVLRA